MPEIVLDEPQVAASVGQVVATCMAQQLPRTPSPAIPPHAPAFVTTRQNALRLIRSARSDWKTYSLCSRLHRPSTRSSAAIFSAFIGRTPEREPLARRQ